MRGLDHGMTSAAEGVIALVVSKQKENVWLAGAGMRKEEAQEKKVETLHGGLGCFKAGGAKSRNPSGSLAGRGN